MRRLPALIIVTLLVAGCAAANVPPSVGPNPGSNATESGTATPSAGSTASCPTDTPLTVTEYLGADPSCFGGRDVAIAGWEDVPPFISSPPTPPIAPAWLVGPVPTVLAPQVPPTPCDASSGPCQWLDVHVDPASKLAFETDGAWVVITGHLGDPAAEQCTYAPPETDVPSPPPTADEVKATCRSSFVLTSVTAAPAPAGALGFCPPDAPMTVATYQATDPVCFHGKTLRIIGWSSLAPAVDFGEILVEPGWLVGGGIGTLWGVKPTLSGGNGQCPGDTTCAWIFVTANPGSGLTLGSSRRWVLVTGHIDDPAAASCQFAPGGLIGAGPFPPSIYARQECRSAFVVTHIANTTAPTG